MEDKRIVIFGAGKIGRSFIGQLFSRGGYEVIFIDINEVVIQSLNNRKKYPVLIKDEKEETLWITNVSGIVLSETDKIINILNTTNLAAICVGNAGFPEVARVIALSIMDRERQNINTPLDVILAENLRNAGEILYKYLASYVKHGIDIKKRIGFVETSIGKMVPVMPPEITLEDPLMIYAEAYNTLIVDAKGFKNMIPEIDGLSAKENMKAWVDRKLFIHNLGHVSAAYYGNFYFPSKIYMWEILEIPEVSDKVYRTMTEAGNVLQKIYPGEFSMGHISVHIKDLIKRFKNRSLGDTIYRVGCDLKRKMSFDDRLIAPMRSAYLNDLPYRNILTALICGCSFSASDFAGNRLADDVILTEEYKNKGIASVLVKYCHLNQQEYPGIFKEAEHLKT
jgi:mannitol-1-phosphate 5-dehydrogenase